MKKLVFVVVTLAVVAILLFISVLTVENSRPVLHLVCEDCMYVPSEEEKGFDYDFRVVQET